MWIVIMQAPDSMIKRHSRLLEATRPYKPTTNSKLVQRSLCKSGIAWSCTVSHSAHIVLVHISKDNVCRTDSEIRIPNPKNKIKNLESKPTNETKVCVLVMGEMPRPFNSATCM